MLHAIQRAANNVRLAVKGRTILERKEGRKKAFGVRGMWWQRSRGVGGVLSLDPPPTPTPNSPHARNNKHAFSYSNKYPGSRE